MNEFCALTPPQDMVEDMLRLMERGARMRLDCIPDDPTLLSASFGSESTPEMAKAIRADQMEAALTELARLGQEIEGEQEKRDREIEENTIPRLANCGTYHAVDNTGLWHYINHAGTWQGMPDLIKHARNKALEEAAVAVDRLAYDAGEAEWRTEFSLSFASDLIRGLKEG